MQQEAETRADSRCDHIGSLNFRVRTTPAEPRPHFTIGSNAPHNLWFVRSVAKLLECNRCYAAFLSPKGELLDQASIGLSAANPASEAIARMISENFHGDGTLIYQSSVAPDGVARRLIGTRSNDARQSVIGRIRARSGDTVIFIAGWRQALMPDPEFSSAQRALEMFWDAFIDLANATIHARQRWLDDLEPPALIVDENLVVRRMNSGCRQLLGEGIITLEREILSGSTPIITTQLKQAVRASIFPDSKQRTSGATVLISHDEQRFLFAVVGTIPGNVEPGLALIYVPQFDEDKGAQSIARAFGLSGVDTRIIRCILCGRCPRAIGVELGFTEETVRTYIKRIMLKLGINRQSELFVLHSRTFSPFRLQQPDLPYIATSTSA